MSWNFESGKPLYGQLCDHIRIDIINGKYMPGDKLPGVRDLALEAEVNPNTMQRALAELEEDGLINTRGTSGKFVTENAGMIAETRDKLLAEIIKEYKFKMQTIGISGNEAVRMLIEKEENDNG